MENKKHFFFFFFFWRGGGGGGGGVKLGTFCLELGKNILFGVILAPKSGDRES